MSIMSINLVRWLLLFSLLDDFASDHLPVVGGIQGIGKPVDKTEEGEERPERSVDKLDEIFLSLGKIFSNCHMFHSISIYS